MLASSTTVHRQLMDLCVSSAAVGMHAFKSEYNEFAVSAPAVSCTVSARSVNVVHSIFESKRCHNSCCHSIWQFAACNERKSLQARMYKSRLCSHGHMACIHGDTCKIHMAAISNVAQKAEALAANKLSHMGIVYTTSSWLRRPPLPSCGCHRALCVLEQHDVMLLGASDSSFMLADCEEHHHKLQRRWLGNHYRSLAQG
jgi:hypothetical protein